MSDVAQKHATVNFHRVISSTVFNNDGNTRFLATGTYMWWKFAEFESAHGRKAKNIKNTYSNLWLPYNSLDCLPFILYRTPEPNRHKARHPHTTLLTRLPYTTSSYEMDSKPDGYHSDSPTYKPSHPTWTETTARAQSLLGSLFSAGRVEL